MESYKGFECQLCEVITMSDYEYPLCPFISKVHPQFSDTWDFDGYDWFIRYKGLLCIKERCRFYVNGECTIKQASTLMQHEHSTHWHAREHEANNLGNIQCGAPIINHQSLAAILTIEFSCGEDLDRDGRIYGKDFKIDPLDETIPPMLLALESNPNLTATLVITWQEYLDSI